MRRIPRPAETEASHVSAALPLSRHHDSRLALLAAAILLALGAFWAAAPAHGATPTINGLYFGDGDLNVYQFLQADTTGGSKGQLYYYIEDGIVYLALVVNKAGANDAVFGDKQMDTTYMDSADWKAKHNFGALEGSDHASFAVECGATGSDPDWSFALDLLYDADGDLDPTEADWRGDASGPDGLPTALPPGFTAATSIAWNMNNTTWDVTLGGTRGINDWKSPDNPAPGDGVLTLAADGYDLNDDSTVAGNWDATNSWEWSLVYEFSFDMSGCTEGLTIDPGTSHNSPSKDSIEDTTWEPRTLLFDWGDLPDGPYATLSASAGAVHETNSIDNVFLGASIDNELDGQPDATATGDDGDPDGDDEDGVVFLTPLNPGDEADIEVTASAAGILNAWIDFNSDGDFADPGEQIASDLAVAAGVNTLDDVPVPDGATGTMPSRFRITNEVGQGGGSPTGLASSGEVEDYLLAALGNLVWNDLDGDGLYEPDADGIPNSGDEELGVEGVVVNLVDTSGFPISDGNGTPIRAMTDADGFYEFPGVPPGDYRVLFDRPAGFTDFSPQDVGGDDTIDSDADQDPFGTGTEGLTGIYTLVTGEIDTTVDAGLRAVTVALITSAGAYVDGGSVVFEFSTGYEALTGGFEVMRFEPSERQWVSVTETLVPALLGAPQGGVYRVLDQDAPFTRRLSYVIVEHQVDGRTQAYGPYTVEVEQRGDRAPLTRASAARANVSAAFAERMARAERVSRGRSSESGDRGLARGRRGADAMQGGIALQFDVRQDGLHYLSAAEIAAASGLSHGDVQSLIASRRLALENRGGAVAWKPVVGQGSGIHFYGQALDSLYTLDNTYWLRPGRPGEIMRAAHTANPPAPATGHFTSFVPYEEDLMPSINATLETEVDHWYWAGINAASSDRIRTFDLAVADAVPGPATLAVELAGATNGRAVIDHHAILRVNGVEIGAVAWGGIERHTEILPFDGSLLTPSTTVEVEGLLDEGSTASIFFIDGFELGYERAYVAADGQLHLTADDNDGVTVDGLPTADVRVLDLTDPTAPALVKKTRVELGAGGYRASFTPADPDTPYLVAAGSAALPISGLRTVQPSVDLRATHHSYEHVVIAPRAWRSAAERLAAHHSSEGTASLAVDLEDVFDAFGDGLVSPWAIRDFLSYARQEWATGPRYLLLAGRGTLDPRDLLGGGDNFVPIVLVGTPYGLVSSDNVLVDLEGDDAIPEVAVGRLPIVSAAELDAYVDKLEAYAGASGDWLGEALLLTDDPDRAGNFPFQSADVGAVLSRFGQQTVDLSQMGTAEARAALQAAWNDGVGVVNYVGHGGVTQFAGEGLLRTIDMPALANGDRLPIVSALTCVIGRSDIPNLESLAEALVTDVDGGAIAVWSPSGLSISGAAHALNLSYAAALERADSTTTLGDVVLDALRQFGNGGGPVEMLHGYNITGDPLVRVP